MDYLLGTRTSVPGARLVGKVDLLIRHPGNILEHIEFKTGSAGSDLYQDIICRIGVASMYGQPGLEIFTTTLQLSTDGEFSLETDRAIRDTALREIIPIIRELWDATAWPARENETCRFCEYRSTLCSLHGEWGAPNRTSNRDD
ncbi:MAG: PD-(D/E)XK nuclease family protein [Thermomicrobiales bacterium]|nr:PD-(D/E)XK nuclease family protein [Thermomicrobiales bacterium]